MWGIKACVVCLSTECLLFKIDSGQLRQAYYLASGLKDTDLIGMPQYLCLECTGYVRRFKKFRDKCKRAYFTMTELLKVNKQLTIESIEAINRQTLNIAPSISYLDLDKTHYEKTKFRIDKDKYNRGSIKGLAPADSIPVFYCSTVDLENEFEAPRKKSKQLDSVDYSAHQSETQSIFNCYGDELVPSLSERVKVEVDEVPVEFNVHEESFLQQSTSVANEEDYFDNDHFEDDDGVEEADHVVCKEDTSNNVIGGSQDQEYATMIPITMKEAQAAADVYKMFTKGNLICQFCNKAFTNKALFNCHLRMHDRHVSGNFQCMVCKLFYKTDFLLKTHMTDKHLYKYVCKKCPEVSFDRTSAKQHYIWTHLNKRHKDSATWYDSRPTWLRKKGGTSGSKRVVKLRPVRKIYKLPDDFLVYTPITHEEQYRLVEDRKNSRNYIESTYRCEMCYKGFREAWTYGNHMKKHDPAVSGPVQCDMCKLHFRDARKIYKHMMISHLFKYSCQICNYVCCNKYQAHMHYRWHKNVTYPCTICDQVFKKASTRLTHIRIKHPSTIICDICGHSFVSENGLYCHKKLAHSKEEMEASEAREFDPSDPYYCADCNVQFQSPTAYKTHLGSSNKHADTNLSTKPVRTRKGTGARAGAGAGGGTRARKAAKARSPYSDIVNNGISTATNCEICSKLLPNDVQARKHYESEHPGAEFLKRYMCDVCGHTTRQYANLMVHMRTHTQEKPYGCPHCDRRFSMPSNRDRHLVVHTGEKKYQCQHCSRRFTQSSAVKLHIQTVHLKIPYAPWDKKNRKRRKELESAGAPPAAPPLKLVLEGQADYLNAYITYNE